MPPKKAATAKKTTVKKTATKSTARPAKSRTGLDRTDILALSIKGLISFCNHHDHHFSDDLKFFEDVAEKCSDKQILPLLEALNKGCEELDDDHDLKSCFRHAKKLQLFNTFSKMTSFENSKQSSSGTPGGPAGRSTAHFVPPVPGTAAGSTRRNLANIFAGHTPVTGPGTGPGIMPTPFNSTKVPARFAALAHTTVAASKNDIETLADPIAKSYITKEEGKALRAALTAAKQPNNINAHALRIPASNVLDSHLRDLKGNRKNDPRKDSDFLQLVCASKFLKEFGTLHPVIGLLLSVHHSCVHVFSSNELQLDAAVLDKYRQLLEASSDPVVTFNFICNETASVFCARVAINYPGFASAAEYIRLQSRAAVDAEPGIFYLEGVLNLFHRDYIVQGRRVLDSDGYILKDLLCDELRLPFEHKAFAIKNKCHNLETDLAFLRALGLEVSEDILLQAAARSCRLSFTENHPVFRLWILRDSKHMRIVQDDSQCTEMDLPALFSSLIDVELQNQGLFQLSSSSTHVKVGQIVPATGLAGTLPKVTSVEEFRKLPPSVRKAINSRDLKAQERVSLKTGDKEYYCSSCKRWVDHRTAQHPKPAAAVATVTNVVPPLGKKGFRKHGGKNGMRENRDDKSCLLCKSKDHFAKECPHGKAFQESLHAQAASAQAHVPPPPPPSDPLAGRNHNAEMNRLHANNLLASMRPTSAQQARGVNAYSVQVLPANIRPSTRQRAKPILREAPSSQVQLPAASQLEAASSAYGSLPPVLGLDFSESSDMSFDAEKHMSFPKIQGHDAWQPFADYPGGKDLSIAEHGTIRTSHFVTATARSFQADPEQMSPMLDAATEAVMALTALGDPLYWGDRIRDEEEDIVNLNSFYSHFANELKIVPPCAVDYAGIARIASSFGVACFSVSDIVVFLEKHGAMGDTGANAAMTSPRTGWVTDLRACESPVEVKGISTEPLLVDHYGTVSAHVLLQDCIGFHPFPPVSTLVGDHGGINVLPIVRLLDDYNDLDGCIHECKERQAKGFDKVWFTVNGKRVQTAQVHGLYYIFLRGSSDTTASMDSHVTVQTSVVSSLTAPVVNLSSVPQQGASVSRGASGGSVFVGASSIEQPHSQNDPIIRDLCDCTVSAFRTPFDSNSQKARKVKFKPSTRPHGIMELIAKGPDVVHNTLGHTTACCQRHTLLGVGLDIPESEFSCGCEACNCANSKRARKGQGLLGMHAPVPDESPGSIIAGDIFTSDQLSISGCLMAFGWVCCISSFCGGAGLDPINGKGNCPEVMQRIFQTTRFLTGMDPKKVIMFFSDNEPVLKSKAVKAVAATEKVLLRNSCPNESRTNDIMERSLGTRQAIMRTFIALAWFPAVFWLILFQHAGLVKNLLATELQKDGTYVTPHSLFTKAAPDYTYLRPPGCCAVYYTGESSKVFSRGTLSVYLADAAIFGQQGFLLYDPVQCKMVVTVSAIFDCSRFPFKEGIISKLLHQRLTLEPDGMTLPDGSHARQLLHRRVRKWFPHPTTKKMHLWFGEVTGIDLDKKTGEVIFRVSYTDGDREDLFYHELTDILIDSAAVYSATLQECSRNLDSILPPPFPDHTTFHPSQQTSAPSSSPPDFESEPIIVAAYASCRSDWWICSKAAVSKQMSSKSRKLMTNFKKYGPGKLNENTYIDVQHAIREALRNNDPDEVNRWKAGLRKELDKIGTNGVFEWCTLPPGEKAVGLGMPAKRKGTVDTHDATHKVRLVARGNETEAPQEGFDVYAAVVAQAETKLVMALMTALGMETECIDSVSAFTQVDAPRDNMYYRPHPEMVCPDPSKPFLRARRAIYGDPQSSKAWFEYWRSCLHSVGFSNVDNAGTVNVIYGPEGQMVLVASVVDDCIVGYTDKDFWLPIKAKLSTMVEFDSSPLTNFAGFEVDYDSSAGIMQLRMTKLIETAAKRFGINDQTKFVATPMDENFMIDARDCPEVPDPVKVREMRSIVGTIGFITGVHNNIKYVTSELSRIAHNPADIHLDLGRRVIAYLYHHRYEPLVFGSGHSWTGPDGTTYPANIPVYFKDAGLAKGGRDVQRRSHECVLGMINGGAFSMRSKLQSTVADSSMKAEMIALYHTCKEVMGTRNFFERLRRPLIEPTLVHEDNNACMSIMNVVTNKSNSRHLEIKYYWISELIQKGKVLLVRQDSDYQLADAGTKAQPRPLFEFQKYYIQGHHLLSDEALAAFNVTRPSKPVPKKKRVPTDQSS